MNPPDLQHELGEHGYHILRQIGEGGSRVVFLAQKDLVADPVVLKVFKQESVHHRIQQKRDRTSLEEMLSQELEVIRRFSHPNLVRCFHHGAVNGSYFLEEEYMEGGSVASHLGTLSKDKILQFFVQIVDGVSYLHSKGFYVRDFKLDNVLTDKDLNVVKISDLELSGRIPASGGTLGSDRYAAPELEQERDSNPIKTDIFALGCGLLYLLTGEATAMQEMNHLTEEHYTPQLVKILEKVDERYRATLFVCLAYNPKDRFVSTLDLKEAVIDQHPLKTTLFHGKTQPALHQTYIHRGSIAVRDMEDPDVDTLVTILQHSFTKHNIFKKPAPLVRTYITNSNITFTEKGGGYIVYENQGIPEGCLLIRPIDVDVKGTHMRVNYNHLGASRGFSDEHVVCTLIEAADRKLSEYLRSQGIGTAKIQINLAPDELALHPTLEKCGFTMEGTLQDHYRFGEEVVLLGKLLRNFHT